MCFLKKNILTLIFEKKFDGARQRGKPTCRPGRVNLTSPCLHLYQTFLLLIALNGIFIIQRRLFFAVSSGPFYARFKLGNISSSINSSLVQGQSVGTLSGRSRDRNCGGTRNFFFFFFFFESIKNHIHFLRISSVFSW